ncbi:MAG TPA: hypothetical protein VEX60_00035 [Pyrinomonadaceae bacterium]|nr:hypothetical protein [Pyrinomonadaceae bacterium]
MDNSLFLKVKNIIRNDTGLGEVRIGGVEIYDKLTAAGVEVPELAIAEILERLAKEKLIEIERQVTPEDQEKHGAYIITWVSGHL